MQLEAGPGGDHDKPYSYRSTLFLSEADAWTRLAARWYRGEFDQDTVPDSPPHQA